MSRSHDQDLQTYRAAHIIGALIHAQQGGPGQVWFVDQRNQGIRPYYGQTTAGLLLLVDHSVPTTLYTPWGAWNIMGSHGGSYDHIDKIAAQVLKHLTVVKTTLRTNRVSGPIYEVRGVRDLRLPRPSLRRKNAYLSPETARSTWVSLGRRSGLHRG